MGSVSSRDKAIASENQIINQSFLSATEQTISVIDIISEGPIYGLVDGQASVFLNGDRIVGLSQTAVPSNTPYTLTITSGSSTATLNQALTIENSSTGTRYFTVEGVFSDSTVTISDAGSFNTNSLLTISTSSGFFESYMLGNTYDVAATKARLVAPGYPTITGAITTINSTTEAIFTANVSGAVRNVTYTLLIDYPLPITSFNGTTVQLPEVAWFSGTFNLRVEGTQLSTIFEDVTDSVKYKDVTTQFRVGNLHQPILSQINGQGNTAISNASFATSELEQSTVFGGEGSTIELVGTSSAGFAVSAAQVKQVDEIRVVITYPSGLYSNSSNTGNTYPSYAFYQYGLQFKRDGVWGDIVTVESNRRHSGSAESKSAFSIEEVFNLEPFAPFDDFKLIIDRRTRHDGVSVTSDGSDASSKYSQVATAALQSVTSIIKEPLIYPYTSYAGLTFSSKEFQSVPSRTYHCKGRLIKVPSNYVTRDEASDGVAVYTRNVDTGVITGTYQDWDGDFRNEVYCNNPAWVFYDIVINNRYGLGSWIDAADLDKYALYRIARYCDELVPDGRGGFEPRFTANLYLTKAADAYKVLKDLATIFRGMLYWIDSSLYPVIDEPSGPVYTFTAGNVIDGRFSYESTGSKTRVNQVIVSWNNPEADYALEALLVEDKNNIIETGRIISQDAVALGTTSEGQALRYGRWKLWTAKNQKEIVSFQTAINAMFLAPGNVINIQDADRFNIQYSGRIPTTGVISTTSLPIDRNVTLNDTSYYELSVVITEPGCFLAQETAIIDSIVYSQGDLLDGEYTEDDASNLLDDTGNPVLTSWHEYSRVETKPVSNVQGSPSRIDLDEALSVIPDRSAIWALKEITSTGLISSASLKQYKIISITEDEKHLYSIVAVEHYNSKFNEIDRDFVSSITDTVYQSPKTTDVVPTPKNVTVIKNGESSVRARSVTIKWQPAVSSGISADYAYVSGYEIHHPLFYPTPIIVGADTLSYTFEDVFVGTYTIGVRTVNSIGNKSELKKVRFTVGDAPDIDVTRGKGLAIGGITNVPSFITSDGYYKFDIRNYTLAPIAAPFFKYTNTSVDDDNYIQDCTDIPAVDFSAISDVFEAELAAHYLIYDNSDAGDKLKLIKYSYGNSINIPFWYDTGTGADSADSTFVSGTGTVTVSENIVTGTGTSFTSEYHLGDIIKFSSTKAGIVVYIESDTKIEIDRSIEGISGSSHSRQGLRLDPTYDCAIAQIKNDSSDGFIANNYITIDSGLAPITRLVQLSSEPPFINFDSFGTLATTYSNIVLTATAVGFTNPEFKITGAGFDNVEISQTAESVFSAGVDKVYTKTLDKVSTYSTTPLNFTVTVREANDPTNTDKQASIDLSIKLVKFSGQKIFYQETAPVSGMEEGDYWVRDSDNRFHRYNGSSWVEIPDDEFASLAADIAIAQATADGKIVSYYQDEAPGSASSGDLWFDTNDGNKAYRYNGSSWLSIQDDQIAEAIDAAADAQSTADGKIVTFVSTSAPTAEGVGDIWMDTDDNNRLYRWNGSSWADYTQDTIGRDHAVATGNPHSTSLSDITSLMSASGSTILAGVGNDFIMEAGSASATFRHKEASLSSVGAYSGTLRTGLFVGSNGILMGYNRKSDGDWVNTISLDGTTGTANYLGDVITSGRVVASGLYTESSTGENAAVIGTVSGSGNIGVLGVSSDSIGVLGVGQTGVWGFGGIGIRAESILPAGLGGVGLDIYGRMQINNTYQVANLNASYLEGNAASDFASSSHNHDGSYSALGHTHSFLSLTESSIWRKIQVSVDGSTVSDNIYFRIITW